MVLVLAWDFFVQTHTHTKPRVGAALHHKMCLTEHCICLSIILGHGKWYKCGWLIYECINRRLLLVQTELKTLNVFRKIIFPESLEILWNMRLIENFVANQTKKFIIWFNFLYKTFQLKDTDNASEKFSIECSWFPKLINFAKRVFFKCGVRWVTFRLV